MSKPEFEKSNRREFLTGTAGRKKIRQVGDKIADHVTGQSVEADIPSAGPMIRLSVDAMACEFALSMNPGEKTQVSIASAALEKLEPLEQLMTIYRGSSDLSRVNRLAFQEKQKVSPVLYEVLALSQKLFENTEGAFDPTMGALISLWRRCRREERLPDNTEIEKSLSLTGMQNVLIKSDVNEIKFLKDSVTLDLGGIGKGFAIDQIVPLLVESGLEDYLFHGGHSSLYASGDHNSLNGWPVGIRNPLIIEERLATILLQDQAMSTSGSNVQYYRFQGKRYGHILDPRTGYPSEKLLSAVVVASSTAEADALSTAFFVMGLEDSIKYCQKHSHVGAILVPAPSKGRKLNPVIVGLPESQLFFHHPERDLDAPEYL